MIKAICNLAWKKINLKKTDICIPSWWKQNDVYGFPSTSSQKLQDREVFKGIRMDHAIESCLWSGRTARNQLRLPVKWSLGNNMTWLQVNTSRRASNFSYRCGSWPKSGVPQMGRNTYYISAFLRRLMVERRMFAAKRYRSYRRKW